MKNTIKIIIILTILNFETFGQNIIVKTLCENGIETVPFVELVLLKNGLLFSTNTSDIDGIYWFRNVGLGKFKLITKKQYCKKDTLDITLEIGKDYNYNILMTCDSLNCNKNLTDSHLYSGDIGIDLNLITVQQYIEQLKKTKDGNLNVIIIEKRAENRWINKKDISYLLTLIESEMKANCVMSAYSSKMPIPNNSTLGGQVMNLIDSYRLNESYPKFLTDCARTDLERVKEIRMWWDKEKK